MVFTWDWYRALLFVHVASVVVALGATFALPLLQPMGARGGVRTLRFVLEFTHRLETRIVGPGSGIAFLSGLALIFNDRTGYSDDMPLWLTVAVAWFLVAAVVANVFQAPNLKKAIMLLDAVPDEGPMPRGLGPLASRMRITGQMLSVSTIGVLLLMVWKP